MPAHIAVAFANDHYGMFLICALLADIADLPTAYMIARYLAQLPQGNACLEIIRGAMLQSKRERVDGHLATIAAAVAVPALPGGGAAGHAAPGNAQPQALQANLADGNAPAVDAPEGPPGNPPDGNALAGHAAPGNAPP